VGDTAEIKTIYSVNGGFTKTAFYPIQAVIFNKKPLYNLFATRDESYHSRIKRPVAHTYSMSALTALEPKIDEVSKLLMTKLQQYEKSGAIVDLGEWLQWYAFDVIGNLTFSRTLGFIEESRDVDNIIKDIGSFFIYAAVIGQVPWLHKLLAGNPLLPIFMPSIETFNPAVNFALKCMKVSKGENASMRDDFLVRFQKMVDEGVKGGVSGGAFANVDILNHTSTNVLAGSDTTAIALRSIVHNLITNPYCYKKLQLEIDEHQAAGRLSDPVQESEARQMPYLQAIIKEAMRLHPSVGMLLERHVPKGGAVICGKYIPENYVVGINPWVAGQDTRVYGEDAEVFRPERWLEADLAQLKEMERSSLAFGAGSRVCIGKNISMIVCI
jgi:cytochrome P450